MTDANRASHPRISVALLCEMVREAGGCACSAVPRAELPPETLLALVEAIEEARVRQAMLLNWANALDAGKEEFDTATLRNLAYMGQLEAFAFDPRTTT